MIRELLRLPVLVPGDGAEGEEQDRGEDQQRGVGHGKRRSSKGRGVLEGHELGRTARRPGGATEAKPPAETLRAVLSVPPAASLVLAEASFATSIWHD